MKTSINLQGVILLLLCSHATFGEDEIRCRYPNLGYKTGLNSFTHTAADINADGILDVLVANINSDDLTLLFGRGDGSFEQPVSLPAGDGPTAVAVADLDGDGDQDLAVTNAFDDSITQFENIGDTFFVPTETYSTGDQPVVIKAADINGDETIDLLVLNSFGATISFFLNDGIGGMGQQQLIDISTNGGGIRRTFALGDIDLDGDLDVVSPIFLSSFVVCLNDGDANFSLPITENIIGISASSRSSALVDFTGNGWPDLILGGDDTISVIPNEDGQFATGNVEVVKVGEEIEAFYCGDVDTDFDFDIVTADFDAGGFAVLFNDGAGGIEQIFERGMGENARYVSLHDFDNDEVLEIGLIVSGLFCVIENDETGTFVEELASTESLGWFAETVDLNRDGNLDFITGPTLPVGDVAFCFGDGNGGFTHIPFIPPLQGHATSLVATDFDGDQDIDLAIGDSEHAILVLLNDGNGNFVDSHSIVIDGCPEYLFWEDFDWDGDVDLISRNSAIDGFSVLENDGAGNFSLAVSVPTPPPLSFRVFDMDAADIDADGDADVVFTDVLSNQGFIDVAIVFRNDGSFGFTEETPIELSDGVGRLIKLVDVNQDGFVDLVVSDTEVSVYLNDGFGNFDTEIRVERAEQLSFFLDVVDLNGDGALDLVNERGRLMAVWMNNGDSSFTGPSQHLIANERGGLILGDFDGDECVDVLAGFDAIYRYPSKRILVGDVNFDGDVTLLDVEPFVRTIVFEQFEDAADINGDGKVDLLDVGPFIELLQCK